MQILLVVAFLPSVLNIRLSGLAIIRLAEELLHLTNAIYCTVTMYMVFLHSDNTNSWRVSAQNNNRHDTFHDQRNTSLPTWSVAENIQLISFQTIWIKKGKSSILFIFSWQKCNFNFIETCNATKVLKQSFTTYLLLQYSKMCVTRPYLRL